FASGVGPFDEELPTPKEECRSRRFPYPRWLESAWCHEDTCSCDRPKGGISCRRAGYETITWSNCICFSLSVTVRIAMLQFLTAETQGCRSRVKRLLTLYPDTTELARLAHGVNHSEGASGDTAF